MNPNPSQPREYDITRLIRNIKDYIGTIDEIARLSDELDRQRRYQKEALECIRDFHEEFPGAAEKFIDLERLYMYLFEPEQGFMVHFRRDQAQAQGQEQAGSGAHE